MANYEIDPKVLEPFIPYGTELDLWKGKCFTVPTAMSFMGTLKESTHCSVYPILISMAVASTNTLKIYCGHNPQLQFRESPKVDGGFSLLS